MAPNWTRSRCSWPRMSTRSSCTRAFTLSTAYANAPTPPQRAPRPAHACTHVALTFLSPANPAARTSRTPAAQAAAVPGRCPVASRARNYPVFAQGREREQPARCHARHAPVAHKQRRKDAGATQELHQRVPPNPPRVVHQSTQARLPRRDPGHAAAQYGGKRRAKGEGGHDAGPRRRPEGALPRSGRIAEIRA